MLHKIIDFLYNHKSLLTKKDKIVLTGANGFLGSRIYSVFSRKNHIIRLNRENVNIYDKSSLLEFIKKTKAEYLIHCGGISNPDYCEKHPEEANKVNVQYTGNLVYVCQELNIKMIFISSAMVFKAVDKVNFSHTKDSIPNAVSIYGQTKIKAEELVKTLEEYLIVRIGWQYSKLNDKYPNTNSMLHFLYNELIRNHKVYVNKNSYGNPTYVYYTVNELLKVFKSYKGIIHICSDTDKDMAQHFIETAKKLKLNISNIEILNNSVENQKISEY